MQIMKKSELSTLFEEFPFSVPLFYGWDVGLRFELGSPDIGVWKDFDKAVTNEAYFEQALHRAESVVKECFAPEDDILLWHQLFAKKRSRNRFYRRLLRHIHKSETVACQFLKEPYEEHYFRHLALLSGLQAQQIQWKTLLETQIRTDFSEGQKRNIPGGTFLVNLSQKLVVHVYDDRGMDVVALDKGTLRPLYQRYESWLLDYDREQMDALFSS